MVWRSHTHRCTHNIIQSTLIHICIPYSKTCLIIYLLENKCFVFFVVEKGKSTFKKISNPNLSYLIKPTLGIVGSVKWKDNSIVTVILSKHLRWIFLLDTSFPNSPPPKQQHLLPLLTIQNIEIHKCVNQMNLKYNESMAGMHNKHQCPEVDGARLWGTLKWMYGQTKNISLIIRHCKDKSSVLNTPDW